MRVTRTRNLDEVLAELQRAPLTYAEHGATAGPLPAGYVHVRRRSCVGGRPGAFARATEALFGWRMHSGAGLVVAADGPAEAGRTVVLGLSRPLSLVLPCRVIWTLHEADRAGFAYGTLPGHPECGEESFVVERNPEGAVWLEITAFSKPGNAAVRLAGPVNRAGQAWWLRRYSRALARCIT